MIYQEIVEIENEINDIIKIILSVPFSSNHSVLEDLLKNIFDLPHWKLYNIETILDGNNENEIISNFLIYISTKITSVLYEDISILEFVIYEKIVNIIINYIEKLHDVNLIENIIIFVDGIPSFSKIIEQRRRRIKNYVESVYKKNLFKLYFEKMQSNNYKLCESLTNNYGIDNNLLLNERFDYFKWIMNRFSIDKSLGPSSAFILKMENIIEIKLKKHFNNSKVTINSSSENGESDFKIFKHISLNPNGDYCIHTSDSDFIYQILVQQIYYKIINKDVNLSIFKYLKNYVQIIEAPVLVKNILDQYNKINNTLTNNYKILWDICLLFIFFGNDHLPASYEIGPELGLDFFLQCHYNALKKNNIISINNDELIDIDIDLVNLNLVLKEMNKTKELNIAKIILQRFFKINNNLISLLIDDFKLNYHEILDFIKKFIIWKSLLLDSDDFKKLSKYDLRNIFMSDCKNKDSYLDLSIFNFNENNKKKFLQSINLIEENIDYFEPEFNGLILYVKSITISGDSYQDLYNLIVEKTSSDLIKNIPEYYEYINIGMFLSLNKNNETTDMHINDYLKKMFHLVMIQFGNMSNFHSDNITFYKYTKMPCLDKLINFIDLNHNNKELWIYDIINKDNIDKNKYITSLLHQMLITPYKSVNMDPFIKDSINNIDNMILDIDNIVDFKYREIDIKKILDIFY